MNSSCHYFLHWEFAYTTDLLVQLLGSTTGTGGPGQGGTVVTAYLQAGAGPSLATVVQVGRERGRRWMRKIGDDAAPGIGLRSLRSLRPPMPGAALPAVFGPVMYTDRGQTKRGHFNFGLTIRLQLVDIVWSIKYRKFSPALLS